MKKIGYQKMKEKYIFPDQNECRLGPRPARHGVAFRLHSGWYVASFLGGQTELFEWKITHRSGSLSLTNRPRAWQEELKKNLVQYAIKREDLKLRQVIWGGLIFVLFMDYCTTQLKI